MNGKRGTARNERRDEIISYAAVRKAAQRAGFKDVDGEAMNELVDAVTQMAEDLARTSMLSALGPRRTIENSDVVGAVRASRTLPWTIVQSRDLE